MFDRFRSDLAFGVRQHLKTPATSAVIVLTLALGIAGTSASFSVVNAFFIRPLPIAQPERVVRLYNQTTSQPYFTISYPDFVDMRALHEVFSGALVEEPAPFSAGIAGSYERVWGEYVSEGYFPLLGLKPAEGRFFAPEEEAPTSGEAVVVLSRGLWKRRFGADRRALGATLLLDGTPFRIVGVAPGNFHGMTLGLMADLWIPVPHERTIHRGGRGYFGIARLHPYVTVGQARAALDLLAARLQREYPDSNRGVRFAVLPEAEGRVFPTFRGSVLGLSAGVVAVSVLVLLVACANVAGLLLVRAAARRSEIGVRRALGASRRRILAQLLTEGASLSLVAGAIGLLVAWQSARWLTAVRVTIARGAPISFDVGVDGRVLAFSFAVIVVTGILFSLAPALDVSRVDLTLVLKDGERAGTRRRSWHRQALVAAQIALSMVLLAGCGLFVRSVQNARQIDLGFDPRGVVTTSVDLSLHGYSAAAGNQAWTRLLDDIRRLPRTQSASLTARLPLDLGMVVTAMGPEGFQPTEEGAWPETEVATIETDYFRTLRIPLLEGREFADRDTGPSPHVIIVNDVIAHQFWPGSPAVGRRVVTPSGDRYEVVGVARRSKYFSVGEDPKPYVYFPLRQGASSAMSVVALGAGDPVTYLREIADAIRKRDPIAPLYDVTTMTDRVGLSLSPTTGGARALAIVAVLALALTSLGLYGTIAQTVSRRTYEIGVRRALGARDADVVWLVVGDATALVLLGVGAGLAAGVGSARLLRVLLFNVDTSDPLVFGVVPLVLLAVSVVAAWIPTWRAVRINAAAALRYE